MLSPAVHRLRGGLSAGTVRRQIRGMTTTTVRPRTPAELAVLVPYQLGYHPGPSVTLTVLHDRRLGLLQRHDLPTDPRACPEVAQRALAIVARERAAAVLLIAFEEDEGSTAPLRAALLARAEEIGVRVQEHLVVREGRWFAPDCREACCPEEGLPLPRPEDVPAVAAFVHAGVAPWASREDLVGGVLPERDEERASRMHRHVEVLLGLARGRGRLIERGPRLTRDWRALLDPGPSAPRVEDLPDAVLARAAWSLEDVGWRDALMSVLAPGTLPTAEAQAPDRELALGAAIACPWVSLGLDGGDGAATGPGDWSEEVLAVRSRLVELARLVPEELIPPTLTLVAHLAWWSGDGTVAGIALERALEVDPDYRLADLMSGLLSHGVRPWDLEDSADAA